MIELEHDSNADSDPVTRRDSYVARIRALLPAAGLTETQLNRKLDAQLQTDGGLDALNFEGLEKVIAWLEGKKDGHGTAP